MFRIIVSILYAILFQIFAMHFALIQRGYWAIGGEIFVFPVLLYVFYKLSKDL